MENKPFAWHSRITAISSLVIILYRNCTDVQTFENRHHKRQVKLKMMTNVPIKFATREKV